MSKTKREESSQLKNLESVVIEIIKLRKIFSMVCNVHRVFLLPGKYQN
jgi:hypothetical protein